MTKVEINKRMIPFKKNTSIGIEQNHQALPPYEDGQQRAPLKKKWRKDSFQLTYYV